MTQRTTPAQRHAFSVRHQSGQTYSQIAAADGVSKECVRYWCRRLRRDGALPRPRVRVAPGLLSRFAPNVAFAVLRLKLEHPRWGPNRLRAKLKTRRALRDLKLPSEASLGRYLHQWPRFRRPPKTKIVRMRPHPPTQVHQRWQIDFKLGIALQNGMLVNLHTVRDPVGEACLAAQLFPAGRVGTAPQRVTLAQVRNVLRSAFTQWQTLPDEVQTDGESILCERNADAFPSVFTLWLVGLGMRHLVIRPGRPTDNAEVERCHRTLNDYAIVGNEKADAAVLQRLLDQARHELTCELPSRAAGCHGQPPLVAHPELLQPRHPFGPEQELARFELRRVDAYLATCVWKRKVDVCGQITIAGRHTKYSVGRRYAHEEVWIKFDGITRDFVFYRPTAPEQELGRRAARGLSVAALTGLNQTPAELGPQQLPLPLAFEQG